jgi:hypothetical protein
MVEGAYGATDETDVTVGVAVADDGSFDKGVHFAVEASMTTGPFSLSGNVVSLDDDIAARAVLPGEVAGGDSRTPWDVTASYMFTDMYEVGGRYQDADDDADTTQWGVVVNRYTQGHDIKWQLEWLSNDSDNDAGDFDLLGLGLAVTF